MLRTFICFCMWFQVQKQLHFTEAAQLRSDILVLRKELNAAKSAPAALEKERDGLGKELEKLKVKMKDIEAKLKSTLIEKSKVEVKLFELSPENHVLEVSRFFALVMLISSMWRLLLILAAGFGFTGRESEHRSGIEAAATEYSIAQ